METIAMRMIHQFKNFDNVLDLCMACAKSKKTIDNNTVIYFFKDN